VTTPALGRCEVCEVEVEPFHKRCADCADVRLELVAHIREQIARDPHAYANDAKLRVVAGKIRQNLTGRAGDATVSPHASEEPHDGHPNDPD